jgi:plasmid maintenance system killer protein
MEIHVPNNKLKRALEDDKECQKRFGPAMFKKIRLRLGALQAAESLAAFWPPNQPPERCHELVGDLANIFSMDLVQPYRLLFREHKSGASDQDILLGSTLDEKERWKNIQKIEVIDIRDTHG